MLSPQLRSEIGLSPYSVPSTSTLGAFKDQDMQECLSHERMILQQMADQYRDGPIARKAEEEDVMKRITLEDIDKEFDDLVPASPGLGQIDIPDWDDSMATQGQGRQVTGEVTLKGIEKTLDSAIQASPGLVETTNQVSEEESSDQTKSILTNSRTHSPISRPFLRLSLLPHLRHRCRVWLQYPNRPVGRRRRCGLCQGGIRSDPDRGRCTGRGVGETDPRAQKGRRSPVDGCYLPMLSRPERREEPGWT